MLAAAGLGWLTLYAWQDNQAQLHARQELLSSSPPAIIPIAAFQRDAQAAVQEVNLRAVVATAHNTKLIEKTNFIQTGEDFMVVLQDETAGVDEKSVRAIILLETDQIDAWGNWALARAVNFTETGPVIEMSGLRAAGRNTSHVSQVLRERGLKKAENFTYLEPFIDGRVVALARLPAAKSQTPLVFGGGGALFALIALAKLLRRRARPQPARPIPHGSKQIDLSANGPATSMADIPKPVALAAPAEPPKPRRSWQVPLRLLAVSAVLFVMAWGCLIWLAVVYLPHLPGKSQPEALWPMIVGSSPLILMPPLLFVGVRSMFRQVMALVAFLPTRSAVSPEPSAVAQGTGALATDRATAFSQKDAWASPVQSTPPVSSRLRGAVSANKMMAWAPFVVGCTIFLLAPKVMNGMLGLNGFQLVTAPGQMTSVATRDAGAATAPWAGGGILDVQLMTICTVLVLAAIAWLLKSGVLALGRRIDPQIGDPWARIEAERMRQS